MSVPSDADEPPFTPRPFVDQLAAQLGRPVCLDDLGPRTVAGGSHGGTRISRKSSAFWVPEIPGRHATAGLCVPVRRGRNEFGHLWVIDPLRTLSESQVAAAQRCADHIAFLLDARERSRLTAEHVVQRRLRLLLGEKGDAESVAAELAGEWHLAPGSRALVLATDLFEGALPTDFVAASALALNVKSSVAETGVAVTWFVHVAAPLVIVGVVPESSVLDISAAARAVAGRLIVHAGSPVSVGVAGPPVAWPNIREACRNAAAALTVATTVDGPGGVRAWPELGSWRLLVHAQQSRVDLRECLHPGLTALLSGKQEDQKDLVRTAEVFCTCGGDVRAAAEALQVDRLTLDHRLGQICEITGLNPRSGEDRFELMLGLRAARLTGLRLSR